MTMLLRCELQPSLLAFNARHFFLSFLSPTISSNDFSPCVCGVILPSVTDDSGEGITYRAENLMSEPEEEIAD